MEAEFAIKVSQWANMPRAMAANLYERLSQHGETGAQRIKELLAWATATSHNVGCKFDSPLQRRMEVVLSGVLMTVIGNDIIALVQDEVQSQKATNSDISRDMENGKMTSEKLDEAMAILDHFIQDIKEQNDSTQHKYCQSILQFLPPAFYKYLLYAALPLGLSDTSTAKRQNKYNVVWLLFESHIDELFSITTSDVASLSVEQQAYRDMCMYAIYAVSRWYCAPSATSTLDASLRRMGTYLMQWLSNEGSRRIMSLWLFPVFKCTHFPEREGCLELFKKAMTTDKLSSLPANVAAQYVLEALYYGSTEVLNLFSAPAFVTDIIRSHWEQITQQVKQGALQLAGLMYLIEKVPELVYDQPTAEGLYLIHYATIARDTGMAWSVMQALLPQAGLQRAVDPSPHHTPIEMLIYIDDQWRLSQESTEQRAKALIQAGATCDFSDPVVTQSGKDVAKTYFKAKRKPIPDWVTQ
jgi:hypothetical protein